MGTVPFTHLFWVRPKTRVGLAICVTVENWNPSAETFTMLAPRTWRSCLPAHRRSSLRTWQPQSLTRNWHTSGRVHYRSCLCPAASGRDPGSPCHSSLSLRAQMKKGALAQQSVCWDVRKDELLQRSAFLTSYSERRSGPEPFLSSRGWRRGSLPGREKKK